jgi:GT2 family glycosyltransferase
MTIQEQTILPSELVVVNNGGLPIEPLFNALEGKIKITFVQEPFPGAAHCRNIGAKNADGNLIFFLDDDIVLSPNYFEEILKVFISDKEEEIGGVEGQLRNIYAPAGLKKIFRPLFALSSEAFDGELLPSGFYWKVNCPQGFYLSKTLWGVAAWRREVLKRYSFDEKNFPGYTAGEDVEFSYRASKEWNLVYTAGAVFDHFPAPNGRPPVFKMGAQRVHTIYKVLALNEELGALNYALMGWYLLGEQTRIFYSALTNKGARIKMLTRLAGQTFGLATLPLIIIRHQYADWLTNWLASLSDE